MRSFGRAFRPGRGGSRLQQRRAAWLWRLFFLRDGLCDYFVCATTHFANAFGRVPYALLKVVGVVLRMLRQVFDAVVNEALSFVVVVPSFCATQLPNALLRSVFVP